MEDIPTQKEKEKEFTLISNKNHSFSINIKSLNSSIQMIGSFKEEHITQTYKIDLSFEELKKNNKYFILYETIDEIYEDITLLMNKNQTKLIEENDSIKIIIPLESVKFKEISFSLNKQIKSDKELVQDLLSLVNELQKEMKDIKEENKNLKSKINILESYIPLLEEYKKDKKEKEEKCFIKNLDSLIINGNKNYNEILKQWINPNIDIKAELLYRTSRDGEKYETFHKLCDNKGPTLLLLKLYDGNILGNYSPISWESKGGWKDDPNIFVFSLSKNIKAMKKKTNNNYGIYCYEQYGPESYFLCFKPGNSMNNVQFRIDSSEYDIDTKPFIPDKSKDTLYKADEVEIFRIILG